jgi:large subunit ribosomal protein L19e
LKCGKNRVWLDSEETEKLANASSRGHIRTLIKNGLIRKRNVEVHSRFRALKRLSEKRKGRHMGIGKRRGCKDARMPQKIVWIRRQRTLRRLLRKYRAQGKIDSQMYKEFYMLSKGNIFKNKKVLIEAIIAKKADAKRDDQQLQL